MEKKQPKNYIIVDFNQVETYEPMTMEEVEDKLNYLEYDEDQLENVEILELPHGIKWNVNMEKINKYNLM